MIRYVLAGHSMGGELIRLYTAMYPKDVAALLFIDAAHESQLDELYASLPPKQPNESHWITQRRVNLGEKWKLPENNDEHIDLVASYEQMSICSNVGSLPIVVITRGIAPVYGDDAPKDIITTWERLWWQAQCEQAALSTNSRHTVAHKSGHMINEDEPEIIIEEIHGLVSSLRE